MGGDEAMRHYRGEAGRVYHGHKRAVPASAVPWVAGLRAEKLARHVLPGDRVFEFGVGTGWNLAALNCRAKLGHDISDFLGEDLRALGVEFLSDLSQLPNESQHVVLCHHSLEHTLEPAEVLRRLKEILVPGGKLLLFAPYETERRYRKFDPNEPNHHLYSWNPQTLGNLVTELGFAVHEAGVGEFGYDRFAASLAVRLRLGPSGFKLIRRAAHLLRPLKETRVIAAKPAILHSPGT
jgi:SAM-dependent methyltransferase